MALHLNISNSLSQLAYNLCADLQRQPGNVFQPQYIVTQTEGMNNWLKLQIAANNGIAANCMFVSPNEIIQKFYYFLGGKFPNMLSPQNLSWLLYAILGEKDFINRFSHVASYYNYEGHDKDLKRMALAEKTADMFDQYQIYRPEWIESWNNEKPDRFTGDKWQQYLWSRAKELSQERLPDKTVVGKHIKNSLKDPTNKEKLKAKIPALHLFGLSITTDYHLEVLFEISKTIDVYFHLVNPAPTVYWFEDRSEKQLAILSRKGLIDKSETNPGNTLLTSWGRVIQDTFVMLFRNEELLNSFQEVGISEPLPDSLLHKIQNDIYNGASKDERNNISVSDIKDGSVNISSCYTISREVEVLYNYLVHLVDQQKETLSPRDIVVMVTDIDGYAPYIKAVFKNAPYKFSFTVADETFVHGDTLVSALSSILKINRHNFKAEEVLQLLDSGFIRKRFGITDLELVRKLVNSASIRFGMEGRNEDDTRFVSWEYGLKRIMYGICISGDDEYIDPDGESLYPLDMVEGSESQQIIRFCHFMQVLMDSINERDRERTIAEWVDYTDRLIQNLVWQTEEEINEDYALLQTQLANFNIADEFMNEKIAFEIFAHSLLQSVSRAVRSGSFAGGGITFCSLIPMRSIPFKVVALLGLNFDKFPRKESPASFNLVEKDKRRRGDRNVKENDKHLFLDTILSAKEYLYISYLGQSDKDNTTVPPSALVDELIDYIDAKCDGENARAMLTTRHPLHSFSQKYNQSLPGYYNYLDIQKPGIIKTTDDNKLIESLNFDEITLEGLIAFFKHPFKVYYNKVLDIYYRDEQVLLSDTEVFDLDSLQKWVLKPKLVSMEAGQIDELRKRLVKTGGLPLRNMSAVAVDYLEKEVIKVRELFKECVGNETEEKVSIEMTIDKSLFKGSLNNIYAGKKMVSVSYSKNENKYLLEAYIRYLAAIASGLNYELYFISASKEAIYQGNSIKQKDAIQRLKKLVRLYKKGHEKIIAFFPGIKIDPAEVDTLDAEILTEALDSFYRTTKYDPYLSTECEDGYFESADIVERYKANAELLVKPLGELFPDYYAWTPKVQKNNK